MNAIARELNGILETEGSNALKLLSRRGLNIFFPSHGMVAQGLQAEGKTINASIGEAKDDEGLPLRLLPLEKLVDLPPQDVFSYASSYGKTELRERWAGMIRQKNPSLKQTAMSKPLVTNALTHALSVVGYMFVNPNDEIILPAHYWGNYRLIFAGAYEAIIKTFDTFSDNNKAFNVSGLKKLLAGPGEKKIILLNFPNNPTGYSASVQEVQAIIEAIKEAAEAGKRILAIMDDAYFGLFFQPETCKESVFAPLASIHENVLACKVDGATKEDYVWGFRVGFLTFAGKGMSTKALKALEDKGAGCIRGSISNASHIAQSLLLAAYNSPDYDSEKRRAFSLLKSRYDAVIRELDSHPEFREQFRPLPFNSGYFMCVAINSGQAEAVRQKLLKNYDTGVIAIGNLVRIAFSSMPEKHIPQLFRNLFAACKDVEKES